MDGIQNIDKVFRRMSRLEKNSADANRPKKASAILTIGSIDKNFAAEGRPEKWQGLADSTKARRRGKSPKILTDMARLRRSHNYVITSGGAEIGTNVIYGPRQHFGYPGGKGRGRSKTPSRKFLMFQEEDIREIGEIFKRHIRS